MAPGQPPPHPWASGNAHATGEPHKGWWFGPYVAGTPHNPNGLEIKWGEHSTGQARPGGWTASHSASGTPAWTVSVLITGRFSIRLPDAAIILSSPGDYLTIPPDTPHTWQALTRSTVLTIRWPAAESPIDCLVTSM